MLIEEFEATIYHILQSMANKYNLKYYDFKSNVALAGKDFAILFQFGRGETDITYLFLKDNDLIEYPFNNFVVSSVTKEDRVGIERKEGLYEHALTDLRIIVKSLENHLSEILQGKTEWFEIYRKSKYGYEPHLSELKESNEITQLLKELQ